MSLALVFNACEGLLINTVPHVLRGISCLVWPYLRSHSTCHHALMAVMQPIRASPCPLIPCPWGPMCRPLQSSQALCKLVYPWESVFGSNLSRELSPCHYSHAVRMTHHDQIMTDALCYCFLFQCLHYDGKLCADLLLLHRHIDCRSAQTPVTWGQHAESVHISQCALLILTQQSVSCCRVWTCHKALCRGPSLLSGVSPRPSPAS